MKTRYLIPLVWLAMAWSAPALGPQENDRRPPPDHGSYVERWLERLKTDNPEEYERLTTLREEDPRAFHDELRERVKQKMRETFNTRRNERQGGKPHADEARGPNDQNPHGGRRGGGRRPFMEQTPEMQELEQEARRLGEQLRSVEGDEQAAVRDRLRSVIGKLFDARESQRREQLQRMRDDLDRFQSMIEKRSANREQIIDNYMEQLAHPELHW